MSSKEMTKEFAKDILAFFGLTFKPGKGTMVDQAKAAAEERGFILKDDGHLYRELTEEDFKENPELEAEGLKIGDEVGLGQLMDKPTGNANNKQPGIKVVMRENVLHDGEKYFSGQEYWVSNEVWDIFHEKKFIE